MWYWPKRIKIGKIIVGLVENSGSLLAAFMSKSPAVRLLRDWDQCLCMILPLLMFIFSVFITLLADGLSSPPSYFVCVLDKTNDVQTDERGSLGYSKKTG